MKKSKFYPDFKVSVSKTKGGAWMTYHCGTAIFSNTRREARAMMVPLFEYHEAYGRYLRRANPLPLSKKRYVNPKQPQLQTFINRLYETL